MGREIQKQQQLTDRKNAPIGTGANLPTGAFLILTSLIAICVGSRQPVSGIQQNADPVDIISELLKQHGFTATVAVVLLAELLWARRQDRIDRKEQDKAQKKMLRDVAVSILACEKLGIVLRFPDDAEVKKHAIEIIEKQIDQMRSGG